MNKIKVLVIFRDSRNDEADIYLQDGGVASIYTNDEGLKTNYYQNRIERKLTQESADNLFDILGEGKMYVKDWQQEKKRVDDEVINDAINWLYLATNEYEFEIEKVNMEDLETDMDVINKINSILII
jgi:gas vesicle protein